MQLFVNNWSATLMQDVSAAATSLEIDSEGAGRLTGLVSGAYYLLTLAQVVDGQEVAWEVVKVTSRSGTVLTVERAQEGTGAIPWTAGALLSLRVTAGTLTALQPAPADGGSEIITEFGPPTSAPPSRGSLYIEDGAYLEFPIYLASGDLEVADWVGPLASYTGRRYIEMGSPDSTPLPVSVGRVRVARAAQDPAAVFTLRLPAANRLRNRFMLDFSVSAAAHAGSTLTIAAPVGSTAVFSISGPATGHTTTSSAISMPLQTMELRVSYCRSYDGQLQVHVLVQHIES